MASSRFSWRAWPCTSPAPRAARSHSSVASFLFPPCRRQAERLWMNPSPQGDVASPPPSAHQLHGAPPIITLNREINEGRKNRQLLPHGPLKKKCFFLAAWPQSNLRRRLRPSHPCQGSRGWRNGCAPCRPGANWPVCLAISDSCLAWGGLFFTPLNEVLLY